MRACDDGGSKPYELNISFFDAFRDTESGSSQWHIPCFLLSQIVALSLRGIPALYIHSFLATPNDHEGVERSGMTRSINRGKLDYGEVEATLGSHESETSRVFTRLKRIISIRRQQPAFHPQAEQRVIYLPNGLFGLDRLSVDKTQAIYCLYNFTERQVLLPSDMLADIIPYATDLLCDSDVRYDGTRLMIPPYGAYWFSREL